MDEPGSEVRLPTDAARIGAALRTNTRALVGATALVAAALIAAVVLLVRGDARLTLLAALPILALVVGAGVIPRLLRGRRGLRVPGDGIALAIGPAGIAAAGLPRIGWDELLGILHYDDSPRIDRSLAVPVLGWGTRLALGTGAGRVAVTFGTRNGSRLRDAAPRSDAGRVRLWGSRSAPTRPGDTTLTLDVLLTPDDVPRALAALSAAAEARGIPFRTAATAVDYAFSIARLLSA